MNKQHVIYNTTSLLFELDNENPEDNTGIDIVKKYTLESKPFNLF